MNLKQAYDMFIFSREEYCTEKTIKNYKDSLKQFISFIESRKDETIDKIDLESVTRADLSAYTIFLRNKPKYEGHPFHNNQNNEKLTNKTINTYQVAVRTFFNYLFDEEYTKEQISKKYKIIKPENKLILPLTEDDVKTIDSIYNAKTETGLRNLCIVHLMLDAGARRGDVINLKINSVNFNDNYIVFCLGKGLKDRTVPLSPKLKRYLYTYLTIYRPMCEHDYFLCNIMDKEQLTESCMKSLFKRMKKHTDLQRLYPHLLRHTFATSYILGGGDIESLRIYMGHADINTTQKYIHFANKVRFNKNIYKLDKKFFKRYY